MPARAAEIAGALEGADTPVIEANVVRLHVPDGGRALPGAARRADARPGIDAIGVDVNRPTLDDVFLTLTGRSLGLISPRWPRPRASWVALAPED